MISTLQALLVLFCAVGFSRAAGALAIRVLGLPQRWALALATGFVAIGNLFVYLLLLGWYRSGVLLTLTAVLTLAGIFALSVARGAPRGAAIELDRSLPRDSALTSVSWPERLIALGFLIALVWLALFPYRGFDLRMYQLPMAIGYAETGGWQWFEDLRYPTFPPLMNLWFAVGVLFAPTWQSVVAQLLALLPLVLLTFVLLEWSNRISARPFFAVAFLLGGPVVVWAGSFGFVDLAMTLCTTIAVYGLYRFFEGGGFGSGRPAWLVLAGFMVGSGMNVKYLAAFFAPLIPGLLLFAWLLGQRSERRPTALLAAVRSFSVPAILVATPWYLNTWIRTGNPVHPFLQRLFGSNPWGWPVYEDLEITRTIVVRQVTNLVRWDSYSPWLFPLVLILAASAGLRIVRRLRGQPLEPNQLAALLVQLAALIYLAFSATSNHDHRYSLPAIALSSIFVAAWGERLLHWLTRRSRLLAHPLVLSLPLAALGGAFAVHQLQESIQPIPPTPKARDQYLEQRLPHLGALRWIREQDGDVAYHFGTSDLVVFAAPLRAIGDRHGPFSPRLLFRESLTGDQINRTLDQWGVDFLLEERCGLSIRSSLHHWFARPRNQQSETVPRLRSPLSEAQRTEEMRSWLDSLEEVHRENDACVYRRP